MNIAEKLNLIAENEKKVYDAGYSKREFDFWNDFVKDRTFWDYAFAAWGHEYISPPFKVMPQNCKYSFQNCKYLKVVESKSFDFSNAETSDTNSTNGNNRTFYGCLELEYIEDIGMPAGYYLRTFENDKKLHTIYVLRSNRATLWSGTFNGCTALVKIKQVIGEIGQNFDSKNSPLDLESAVEVLTHLTNYKGTDEDGKYTVAFSPTTWEYLNASTTPEGGAWSDYIESKGFLY